MTSKRVIVCRCPRCGSTNAGADEARSAYDFTFMQCCNCGIGELVDSYERDADWQLEIELPDEGAAVPAFVPPLAPRTGFYEALHAARDGALAIDVEELATLRTCREGGLEPAIASLGRERRFLIHSHDSGGSPFHSWRVGGLVIGPHD